MYPQALNLVDQVELGLLKQSSATQFQPTSPGREGLRGKRRASHNQPQNPSTGKSQGMFHCQRVVYLPPASYTYVRIVCPRTAFYTIIACRCCIPLLHSVVYWITAATTARSSLSHTIVAYRCRIPLSHTVVTYHCCIPLLHTIVYCRNNGAVVVVAHHCSLAHCCLLPSRKLFVSTHIPCISCHC